MTEARKQASTFVLGRDAGRLGRVLRLIVGVLLLSGILWDVMANAPPRGFYGATALYFVVVTGVYFVAHYLLGEGVFARMNPWISTLILIGPRWRCSSWTWARTPSKSGYGSTSPPRSLLTSSRAMGGVRL